MPDFKDIGVSYGKTDIAAVPQQKDKYYPHIEINLKECPELNKDIGEECIFLVKAKVVSKRLDENSKTMSLEVREIAPNYSEKSKNEADQALDDLKNGKRYG